MRLARSCPVDPHSPDSWPDSRLRLCPLLTYGSCRTHSTSCNEFHLAAASAAPSNACEEDLRMSASPWLPILSSYSISFFSSVLILLNQFCTATGTKLLLSCFFVFRNQSKAIGVPATTVDPTSLKSPVNRPYHPIKTHFPLLKDPFLYHKDGN